MSEKDGLIRLAKAIGYPQEVPAEAELFDFLVDGEVVTADAGEGCVLLTTVLTTDEETAGRLAAYAAGRLMKEDAVLAWDAERHAAILWKKVQARGEGEERRSFESFCGSADWWRERVKGAGQGRAGVAEMLIRP